MVPRPPEKGVTYRGWHDPEWYAGRQRELEIEDFRKWYIKHHTGLPAPFWDPHPHPPPTSEVNEAVAQYLRDGYRYPGYPHSNAY